MVGGVKLVAPDGGWGWMVVLGMSINNLITIPILQNFGLLFRDVFRLKALDMSVREASIIINTNSAFGYVLGVLNGPILRTLGFRKVAISGGLMMFVGLFVTSFANNFALFFVFYGLINSLGIGWSMASFHLALSTYFVKRRGMAMGIAMTITGLGPVFMPLVISYLMGLFGARGTTLLLSGLVLHCVLCGQLLQPIKWHRKRIVINEANGSEKQPDEEKAMLNANSDVDARRSKRISVEVEAELNGEKKDIEMKNLAAPEEQEENLLKGSASGKAEKAEVNERWYTKVVRTFDLDLLRDPAFLSMCVGMAIALASDMNFSLMLPLILGDYQFNTTTTAILQSVVGAADILSRLFTPFIINKTKLSARFAYLLALFGLIISRFWLTLTYDFTWVMVVVAFFGACKGVRSVFMPLVIPNYVPLDKLPSAQGLQNIMHGLFLMMLGPLIGYLRDRTGNYILCIHVMNSLTALTIFLWALEFVYMRKQKKNTFEDQADVER
ncbi:monocarboxylate transporter 6-like isoform X2 [Homalodisca vitripennis]|uniref:monocarboxylate transporter 6-like isoform X2 n=1 Tax=Homalodisca vitripennis TaxID=197043 RepID=UPI001EEB6E91|nr:monocarboxylate transporter 6-like isoform X2 [Homalodisca vitripennis]